MLPTTPAAALSLQEEVESIRHLESDNGYERGRTVFKCLYCKDWTTATHIRTEKSSLKTTTKTQQYTSLGTQLKQPPPRGRKLFSLSN